MDRFENTGLRQSQQRLATEAQGEFIMAPRRYFGIGVFGVAAAALLLAAGPILAQRSGGGHGGGAGHGGSGGHFSASHGGVPSSAARSFSGSGRLAPGGSHFRDFDHSSRHFRGYFPGYIGFYGFYDPWLYPWYYPSYAAPLYAPDFAPFSSAGELRPYLPDMAGGYPARDQDDLVRQRVVLPGAHGAAQD